MDIAKQTFGKTSDEKAVDLYTLTNDSGMVVKITNFGGIITSLKVPDRDSIIDDVVLGFDSLEEYLKGHPYFGAIVGRYANRICKGKFTLNGIDYTLATNQGGNHLHGGNKGFDKVVWDAYTMKTDDSVVLKLEYLSPDREEGYPGNLSCIVIYTLTEANELKIFYEAKTDKTTIINLTHHGYYNLAGHGSGDILGHELMLTADNYTPVDDTLIPTGEIKSVKGSPLDFTSPHTIGSRIDQLKNGYDNNYVLNKPDDSLVLAASVYEPKTGRVMEVLTTEPGIQFYSAYFLDGSNKGKGAVYNSQSGFCLEAQHFPDSPNKLNFPSVVLIPEENYKQLTIYRFSTR
jgi:aldose 1-epimerase